VSEEKMKKILIYGTLALSFLSNSANASNNASFDPATNKLSTGIININGTKSFENVDIQFDFATSTFQLVKFTNANGVPVGDGLFKLTTQFRENENECLEGNQINGSLKNGAAFMDQCQNVSGQLWRAVPAENGYFRLTTYFRESENECLEGNQINGSLKNGAAFMDQCQNVSGQLWKAMPAGNGYFKLTTQFRENENECLEGNQVNGSRDGVAFMDQCQDVSGQLWKFVEIPPVTITLATKTPATGTSSVTGDFSKSCENSIISDSTLTSSCRKVDGTSVDTTINLNNHIGNTDGVLSWIENGNFTLSCKSISLNNGNTLGSSCRKVDQSSNDTSINLDEHIANIDGVLTFVK